MRLRNAAAQPNGWYKKKRTKGTFQPKTLLQRMAQHTNSASDEEKDEHGRENKTCKRMRHDTGVGAMQSNVKKFIIIASTTTHNTSITAANEWCTAKSHTEITLA